MTYKVISTGERVVADKEFMDAIHPGDYIYEPDPVVTPTVPQSVTARQAKQALVLQGKYNLVQPAIDAIPDATQRALMQIEWNDSQEFHRQRASVIQIGAAVGYNAAGLDAVFTLAATL